MLEVVYANSKVPFQEHSDCVERQNVCPDWSVSIVSNACWMSIFGIGNQWDYEIFGWCFFLTSAIIFAQNLRDAVFGPH
jgi:hypothetical protein